MELRNLFVETKRYILTIIRCQTGKNLLDILERPVTTIEEEKYKFVRQAEESTNASRQQKDDPSSSSSPTDRYLFSFSFFNRLYNLSGESGID